MNKTAVIYARVSTSEQGKGYSLPTQLEACRRYAHENGYRVIAEYQDMHSGMDLERPGLEALFDFLMDNQADTFLAYDIDRLSRNVGHLVQIELRLTRAGLGIIYVNGGYEDTDTGRLVKMIKAVISENENRTRSERSIRGKLGKVRAGHVLCPAGRAPFGYNYITEEHKGMFEINEPQAQIVRQIYSWLVDEGYSSYRIAKELWERGILSKGDFSEVVIKKAGRGEWSPSTVRRIISNPVYKGEWYFNKKHARKTETGVVVTHVPEKDWVMVNVPAVVDATTWERAQLCLARNKANSARNTRREYLLRSMVFCPCGRRWTVVYKPHLQRAYYRCPSNESEHWRKKCENRFSIRQERLENTVWWAVINILLDPENLRAEIEKQRINVGAAIEQNNQQQTVIEETILDIDRRLGILLDQLLAGSFAIDIINERKRGLESRRKELEYDLSRLRRLSNQPVITLDQEEQLTDFAQRLHENLSDLTPEDKRRVLEMLELRIDVISREQVKISGIISDGLIVNIISS